MLSIWGKFKFYSKRHLLNLCHVDLWLMGLKHLPSRIVASGSMAEISTKPVPAPSAEGGTVTVPCTSWFSFSHLPVAFFYRDDVRIPDVGMAQVPRSSYWNRVKIEFNPKYLPPQKKKQKKLIHSHTTHTGKMLKKSTKIKYIPPKKGLYLPPGAFGGLSFGNAGMLDVNYVAIYLKTLPGWVSPRLKLRLKLSAISYQQGTTGNQGTTHRVPPKLSDSTIGVPHLQAQYLLSIILGHWLFQVSGMARGSRGSCSIEPRQTDFFE